MQAYGTMQKIPFILNVSIQYLVEMASSFMLLLLYLKENSKSEPEMVVAATDSVDTGQKTSTKYH
jgi:hypothetical protein